jgi:SAM-dependent methyltransferase
MYKFPALYHHLHIPITEDTDFYVKTIKKSLGPISSSEKKFLLELGCGTGRITAALSDLTFTIGMDKDPKMLEYAKKTYVQEQIDEKLVFIEGEFPGFPFYLPEKYQKKINAIVLPLNTLSHLTLNQVEELFAHCFEHLTLGGLLLAGVLNPRKELEELCDGSLTFEYKGKLDEYDDILELYESSTFTLANKSLYTSWFYYLGGQDVVEESHLLHLHTKEEYENVIKQSSFTDFEFYGDYAYNPWTADSKMLILKICKTK